MRGIAAAPRRAWAVLALALIAAPGMAQEQTSAPALMERLQQIQGQLQGGGQPTQGQPSRADELVRRIEAMRQQSAGEAAADRQPALGEQEVRKLVQDGLGVDVLSVEVVEQGGRPVYALTVMNPPGNYNGAFQVATLLVDGATGGLLGQVPHTPRASDPDLAPGPPAAGFDGSGPEIRRRSHR